MEICFVNPEGCHVTADHLHMPGQASLGFILPIAVSTAYTNELIHSIYVIMFHIILNKLWPFICSNFIIFMRCVPVQLHYIMM